MEAAKARHDSLADQLLELQSIQEARIDAEEEARRAAVAEELRRQEAEAERLRQAAAEARRLAQEEAEAKARAAREAEDQMALQRLEADLRDRLKQEAEAREAELRRELEAELDARVQAAGVGATRRIRALVAGAVAIVLVAGGVYAFVVAPELDARRFDVERLGQTVEVLRGENQRLEEERSRLQGEVERLREEASDSGALRERPKKPNKIRRQPKPATDRGVLPGLELGSDDPLEGLE